MKRPPLILFPLLFFSTMLLFFSLTDGHGWKLPQETGGISYTTATGDGGHATFSMQEAPCRVLVTYPGATELLIDLDLANRIAGTVRPYGKEPSSYAAAYEALPLLAAPYLPSREEVLAASPDFIIGWSHHFTPEGIGDVYDYAERGIHGYIVPATVRRGRPTLESTIYPFIEDMGHIFGVEERAAEYAEGLRSRQRAAENRAAARGHRFTAIILQAHGNSLYSMYGPTYLINDIARSAGADNLISHQMRAVGPERVLGFAPDVILYVNAKAETKEEARAELQNDPNLKNMWAIRENHIIVVDYSDINNGNGRCITALEIITNGLDDLAKE